MLSFRDENVLFEQHWDLKSQAENQSENDIEQEQHEIFSIVISNTIRNPRTVMIHIQHTSLTCGTVMTSICN